MTTKLTGLFETRQMAELAVERLVQEYQLNRTDISVAAAGDENTAGEPSAPERPDPDEQARNGKIAVSVATEQQVADRIRQAFEEFQSSEVVEE